MEKYTLYLDRDNDIWLGYQDKLYAYDSIDAAIHNGTKILSMEDREVEDLKQEWDLKILHEHEDLDTLGTEAKLMMLLEH